MKMIVIIIMVVGIVLKIIMIMIIILIMSIKIITIVMIIMISTIKIHYITDLQHLKINLRANYILPPILIFSISIFIL